MCKYSLDFTAGSLLHAITRQNLALDKTLLDLDKLSTRPTRHSVKLGILTFKIITFKIWTYQIRTSQIRNLLKTLTTYYI